MMLHSRSILPLSMASRGLRPSKPSLAVSSRPGESSLGWHAGGGWRLMTTSPEPGHDDDSGTSEGLPGRGSVVARGLGRQLEGEPGLPAVAKDDDGKAVAVLPLHLAQGVELSDGHRLATTIDLDDAVADLEACLAGSRVVREEERHLQRHPAHGDAGLALLPVV